MTTELTSQGIRPSYRLGQTDPLRSYKYLPSGPAYERYGDYRPAYDYGPRPIMRSVERIGAPILTSGSALALDAADGRIDGRYFGAPIGRVGDYYGPRTLLERQPAPFIRQDPLLFEENRRLLDEIAMLKSELIRVRSDAVSYDLLNSQRSLLAQKEEEIRNLSQLVGAQKDRVNILLQHEADRNAALPRDIYADAYVAPDYLSGVLGRSSVSRYPLWK